jgi:hypothetical protein
MKGPLMIRLMLMMNALLCVSVLAEDTPAKPVVIGGLILGTDLVELKEKSTRRSPMVGPGKSLISETSTMKAISYRYGGSFNKDRGIASTMLYFNAQKQLGSYTLMFKKSSNYKKYLTTLNNDKSLRKIDDTHYEFVIIDGDYKGCKVTIECMETKLAKRKKAYSMKVQSMDMFLKAAGAVAGKKQAETGRDENGDAKAALERLF